MIHNYDSKKDFKHNYTHNELFKVQCFIKNDDNDVDNLGNSIVTLLDNIDKVYSYKILMCLSDGQLNGWQIEFLISQVEKFNTIKITTVIMECTKTILDSKEKEQQKVLIGFKQPPLELILKLYEPLVTKLANAQSKHWPIEYYDLCQICRMCIVILYKKGYYIHKNLINTTFIRQILQEMRINERQQEAISFHNLSKNDVEYMEYIEDDSALEEFDAVLYEDEDLLEKRRNKVIDIIGKRTYDQLLREYRTKSTTSSTRKLVNKLKNQLLEV